MSKSDFEATEYRKYYHMSFIQSKGRRTRAAEQLQQLQRQRQPGMGHKIFRPHFADEVPPRV